MGSNLEQSYSENSGFTIAALEGSEHVGPMKWLSVWQPDFAAGRSDGAAPSELRPLRLHACSKN